jgi:hypothetical protein
MAFPYSGITPKAPTRGEYIRDPEVLSATGVKTSTTALRVGEFATLVIGPAGASSADVSVAWGAAATLTAVAGDVEYSAGSVISWEVDEYTKYVSVMSNDGGLSPHKAWLHRSS